MINKRQNLIERVLTIGVRNYQKDSLKKEEKEFILRAYYEFTGERLNNDCSTCFGRIYQYFLNLNSKQMNETKFKLKPGKRLMLHGGAEVLTASNLTDEKAILLLQRVPAAVAHFDVVPDNLAELLGKPVSFAKKPVVKASQPAPAAPTAPAAVPEAEIDVDAIRMKNLQNKTEDELRALALSLEIPEKKTKKASKDKLVKLVFDATA